jgi:uncharacterized protein
MTEPHAPAFRRNIQDLLRAAALPIDKFGHQPRLYALTLVVGEGSVYDDDVVFAASYLHDLGVFIGHRPEDPEQLSCWDHVAYTLENAPRLLIDAGFPQGKISQVLASIRTHQPHDKPDSLEATILRDADILEQLGAVGILRAVAKTGRDTRYSTFTSVIAFLRKSLRDLPAAIQLPTTRVLAEPRIALLEKFLAGVEAEAQGALY